MSATYDWIKSHWRKLFFVDDPADATVVRIVGGWHAMGQRALASLLFVSGTGVLTFRIMAATDAAGAGSTLVKAHPTPTTADAPGDTLHIETHAEEVEAALAKATHVAIEVDNSAVADINTVAWALEGGLAGGRFANADLTADVIA